MIKKFAIKFIYKIKNYYSFVLILKDFNKFKKLNITDNRFKLSWKNRKIITNEKTIQTSFDPHYTYHPAWAARIIKKINPKKHIDLSSTLHFATMLSAFIPVEFYDLRPANINLENLKCGKADLNKLPFQDNSVKSLSCMHTIEHIGLGRYGDKIDPQGDIKAIKELIRVLAQSGNLLFVVPLGKSRLMFNAHRIYSYEQIIEYFKKLNLKEFSLITKEKNISHLIKNAPKEIADRQSYGCGCFWFIK